MATEQSLDIFYSIPSNEMKSYWALQLFGHLILFVVASWLLKLVLDLKKGMEHKKTFYSINFILIIFGFIMNCFSPCYSFVDIEKKQILLRKSKNPVKTGKVNVAGYSEQTQNNIQQYLKKRQNWKSYQVEKHQRKHEFNKKLCDNNILFFLSFVDMGLFLFFFIFVAIFSNTSSSQKEKIKLFNQGFFRFLFLFEILFLILFLIRIFAKIVLGWYFIFYSPYIELQGQTTQNLKNLIDFPNFQRAKENLQKKGIFIVKDKQK